MKNLPDKCILSEFVSRGFASLVNPLSFAYTTGSSARAYNEAYLNLYQEIRDKKVGFRFLRNQIQIGSLSPLSSEEGTGQIFFLQTSFFEFVLLPALKGEEMREWVSSGVGAANIVSKIERIVSFA